MADDESGAFRALDFFADFDDEQLKLLGFVSEVVDLVAGDLLYEAGAPANGAYVLVSGQLQAVHAPREGAARFDIDAPALVGEMGLMLSRPRPTTIIARRACSLLFVPREPFLKILRTDPALADSIAAILRAELARYLDSVTGIGPRFSA